MIKTKHLRQSVTIKASPHAVYEALMDAKKHAKFTGGKARISRRVDGRFSIFDGWVTGYNCELVKDKKINQCWRGEDWPKEHYSDVTFALKKVKGGTRLTLTQRDIPASKYAGIKQGWKDYYWEPMKEMLER